MGPSSGTIGAWSWIEGRDTSARMWRNWTMTWRAVEHDHRLDHETEVRRHPDAASRATQPPHVTVSGSRSERTSRFVSLVMVAVVASCGGSTPSRSGSSTSVAPAGSAVPGTAAPSGSDTKLPPEVLAALTDPSRTRLSTLGADLDAAIDAETGLLAHTDQATVDWLTDQRSKVVKAVLDANGVDSSVVGAWHLSTERMAAAVGPLTAGLGEAWIGASIGVPFMLGVIAQHVGEGSGQFPTNPISSHDERTVGDLRIVADSTAVFAVSISGSTAIVDADINQTASATDTVHGTSFGSSVHRTHIRAELNVCPDAQGVVVLKMQVDITSSTTGGLGATAFEAHATGEQRGQVGDDASLQTVTDTIDMSYGTSGIGGATTGSGQITINTAQGPGGASTVTGANILLGTGTMTQSESIKWQNFLMMTITIASQQAFTTAKEQWQGGKCVRIEASERTRNVDPDALVHFTAKPVHQIEQVDLDKPIVATFTGVKSAIPMDQELDPVASMTFTAGSNTGDQGTVNLKSTSNRGIATLTLTFTVKPPMVYELEIDSKISLTKIAGLPANATAKAKGRITLEKVLDDTWRGEGTLISTTTSRGSACNTVHVDGQGVYDWVVSKVVMSPTTPAQDIVVYMDNGTINEAPDPWMVTFCPGGPTLTGTLNTWENPFFLVHGPKDYKTNGFEVRGWTIKGTAATWTSGGLIAEAHWSGSCAATGPVIPGLPSGFPTMPPGVPSASSVVDCSEATTFRLYATVPPSP